MDLREIGWEGVDQTHLGQDRDYWWALVNTVMNFLFLKRAGNFLTRWLTVSFSRRTLLHEVSFVVVRDESVEMCEEDFEVYIKHYFSICFERMRKVSNFLQTFPGREPNEYILGVSQFTVVLIRFKQNCISLFHAFLVPSTQNMELVSVRPQMSAVATKLLNGFDRN
jgi:hypothetical protein